MDRETFNLSARRLSGTTSVVTESIREIVGAMSPAKALHIALYGESVASYRYRVLCADLPEGPRRSVLAEMAEEEAGHHKVVQDFLDAHYPGADFVLSPSDKALVIAGPRMPEIDSDQDRDEVMQLIYESELRTGHFYNALHACIDIDQIKPFLKEMADECFEHAERLKDIPAE